MNNETSRKAFEAWWSEYADIDSDKDSAKDAWQASRKALEAEQAQQVAVPAATVPGIFVDENNHTRMCIDTERPLITELLTHSGCISKREPMTDAEINGLFLSIKKELFSIPGGSANVPWHRRVIVRAVEAHYGVNTTMKNYMAPIEIDDLFHLSKAFPELNTKVSAVSVVDFTRAIEAHHGITPQGDTP